MVEYENSSTCLPLELSDLIVHFTNSLYVAVCARSVFCCQRLQSSTSNESTFIKFILMESLSDIVFLHRACKVSNKLVTNLFATYASPSFFKRGMRCFTNKKSTVFLDIFQHVVKSGNVEKAEFLFNNCLEPYNVTNIQHIRILKHFPPMLTYLGNKLKDYPDVIFTEESISVALCSNNVMFLMIAENQKNIRNICKRKDLIIAAHLGFLQVLDWYHMTCACLESKFASCIFEEDIYNVAVRARQKEVVRYLQNETNCIFSRDFPFKHEFDFPRLLTKMTWFL